MPSWSWISVLRKVDFQFYPEDRDTVEPLSTLKPIIEGRLETKGPMITGLKIGPAVQLAHLQSLRMIRPSGDNVCRLWNIPRVHMEPRVWPMRRLSDKEIVGLALPDVDTDFESSVTFFILFRQNKGLEIDSQKSYLLWGLLLENSNGNGCYKRLGIGAVEKRICGELKQCVVKVL